MRAISILVVMFAALWFAPQSSGMELSLPSLMDARYGAGNWSQRTAPGNGTDIGPALEDGFTTLRANGGRGIIKIPSGSWQLTFPPNPNLVSGNYIIGEGSMASKVYFNSNSGAAFYWNSAGGYSGGGMKGVAILLEPNLGDTNAYAILVQGDATYQPDQMSFEDLYISATQNSCGAPSTPSYWYNPVQFYGNARTSPQGIRGATLKNIQVFCGRNLGVYMSNVVQYSIENLGVYVGKPGTSGMDAMFSGGGSASTNTIHLTVSALNVGGTLWLNEISSVALQGNVGVLNTNSTATYVSGWLRAGGTVGVVGANSNLTVR
jgi:hypothetical protein